MSVYDKASFEAKKEAFRRHYAKAKEEVTMGETERKGGKPYTPKEQPGEFDMPIGLREALEGSGWGPGVNLPGIGVIFLPDVSIAHPELEMEDDGQGVEPIPVEAKAKEKDHV